MLYSRSAEYAIRALVHIATLPRDEYVMARTIAANTEIPSHFLAKILQDVAREGLLKSIKGPGGGFRLALPASEIPLLRVIEAVDGPARLQRCPMGLGECTDRSLCGMHDSWKLLQSRIIEYTGATSVADVAESLLKKSTPQASDKAREKNRPLAHPRRRAGNRGSAR